MQKPVGPKIFLNGEDRNGVSVASLNQAAFSVRHARSITSLSSEISLNPSGVGAFIRNKPLWLGLIVVAALIRQCASLICSWSFRTRNMVSLGVFFLQSLLPRSLND